MPVSSSHQQSRRQLQECRTPLPVSEVLDRAVAFFAQQGGVYTAFPETRGPAHVVLRGQGNEEVVIGAQPLDGATRVTGSSYLFDQQVARFLSGLPPVVEPAPGAAPAAPVEPPALPEGA